MELWNVGVANALEVRDEVLALLHVITRLLNQLKAEFERHRAGVCMAVQSSSKPFKTVQHSSEAETFSSAKRSFEIEPQTSNTQTEVSIAHRMR